MELYISDHPLDCLTCSANGDCELQDMAGVVGLRDVRYGYDGENHLEGEGRRVQPVLHLRPRASASSAPLRARLRGNAGHLRADDLGPRLRVARVAGHGRAISWLRMRPAAPACRPARPRRCRKRSVIEIGQPEHSVVTTCAYCGVGCGFKAEMKGDEVVRMVPWKDGKANEGHSCVKGRFAWGYATHKDRITKPMIRAKITDPWREVSWDEAIDYAASEFKRIQAKYGRDSIGGITSSRCTNEETYLVQKLVRAASATTTSTPAPASAIRRPATAWPDLRHLGRHAGPSSRSSKSDVIMVIGANPTDAHPVFASRMKKRLRQGAKLIVVDPRRIDLVNRRTSRPTSTCRCGPAPTSRCHALAHVIVTEGLVDEAFVASAATTRFRGLWRVRRRPENSPEASRSVTGVPAPRCAARLRAAQGCSPPAATARSTTASASPSTARARPR
jgi:formate dehydrogenase major subunit